MKHKFLRIEEGAAYYAVELDGVEYVVKHTEHNDWTIAFGPDVNNLTVLDYAALNITLKIW
jgi:hypothetical protein